MPLVFVELKIKSLSVLVGTKSKLVAQHTGSSAPLHAWETVKMYID